MASLLQSYFTSPSSSQEFEDAREPHEDEWAIFNTPPNPNKTNNKTNNTLIDINSPDTVPKYSARDIRRIKLETQNLVQKAKNETKEAYKEKNELQNVMEEYTKTIEKMIGKASWLYGLSDKIDRGKFVSIQRRLR